jgi:hypothetical protein
MKDSMNTAKLLDLPYAPEAEEYLDELERSGQFRVGVEALIEEDAERATSGASNDYLWGRGSGSISIQDWWTTGRVVLRVGPGITPAGIVIERQGDSLMVRTQDGLDCVVIENYLGLIPDASTLRILFADGTEWARAEVMARIASWVVELDSSKVTPTS